MPSTTKTKSRPSTSRAQAPAPQATATVDATGVPAPHALSPQELELLQGAATDHGAAESDAAAGGAGTAPTMRPPSPGEASADESVGDESAGAGINGQKVVALWAEQSNRNAYAYLQTAGWRKLSPLTDAGSTTMTLLAAHARATGSAPVADVDSAGVIAAMYVW